MSESIDWYGIHELPDLIYDHREMVEEAIRYVRNQINYLPIGMTLLPEKFTMKELQNLYESILEKKLDRGNFQRKMLKLGIFKRHEKQLDGGAHKAPYLYSFDEEKYQDLLDKANIPHEWYLYPGFHEDKYWKAHLEQYIRWYTREW